MLDPEIRTYLKRDRLAAYLRDEVNAQAHCNRTARIEKLPRSGRDGFELTDVFCRTRYSCLSPVEESKRPWSSCRIAIRTRRRPACRIFSVKPRIAACFGLEVSASRAAFRPRRCRPSRLRSPCSSRTAARRARPRHRRKCHDLRCFS